LGGVKSLKYKRPKSLVTATLAISGAGTNLKVGEASPAQSFVVVPLHFFDPKRTVIRFGEHFSAGQ